MIKSKIIYYPIFIFLLSCIVFGQSKLLDSTTKYLIPINTPDEALTRAFEYTGFERYLNKDSLKSFIHINS